MGLEQLSSTRILSRWNAWVRCIVELCTCMRMRSTWFAASLSPTYPDKERGSDLSLYRKRLSLLYPSRHYRGGGRKGGLEEGDIASSLGHNSLRPVICFYFVMANTIGVFVAPPPPPPHHHSPSPHPPPLPLPEPSNKS
jgi:hypothetical protein